MSDENTNPAPPGNMSAEETPHREFPDKPVPDPFLVREHPDLGDAGVTGTSEVALQPPSAPAAEPQPASHSVSSAAPPPASTEALADVDVPPADGGAGPGAAASDTIANTNATPGVLIEHPVQGAALIAGTDIPPAEAQPIVGHAPSVPAPETTLQKVEDKIEKTGHELIEELRALLQRFGQEVHDAANPLIQKIREKL